jgi:hypothetical protein
MHEQTIIGNSIWAQQTKANFTGSKASCVAAYDDKMSSLGIFNINLWMKGKIFMRLELISNELSNSIIMIDFIHVYKPMYDAIS